MPENDCISSTIDLRQPYDPTPLRVSMESFFELSFWLAEELEDLVAGCAMHESANDIGNARINRPAQS